jgi:hypothetical protein
VRAARAAVAALDRYAFKVKSFKDASFELVEQAHLAMSRLEQVGAAARLWVLGGCLRGFGCGAEGGSIEWEPSPNAVRMAVRMPLLPLFPQLQAVAARAAPELILLACEVKVAAQRGVALLRTYGQYHFLGKLVAWGRRGEVAARFALVSERLRGLMPTPLSGPSDVTPVVSGVCVGATPFSGAAAAPSALGPHGVLERAVTGSCDSGALGKASGGQLLRTSNRGRHERVYAVSFVPPALAAATGGLCVWWAMESAVEFYSDVTQATTSFAIEGDTFLTAIAIDGAGNTWGGTSRGSLLVRRPRAWDTQAEERLFTGAVRALAFDGAMSMVWAGDERGCLRGARLHDDGWRIEPAVTALAGQALARRGLSAAALFGRTRSSAGRCARVCKWEGPPAAPTKLGTAVGPNPLWSAYTTLRR